MEGPMRTRTPAHRRADRLAQQKKRGSKTSPVTEAENAKILLAWEAGSVPMVKVIDALPNEDVTMLRERMIQEGVELVGALTRKEANNETP
jgi:hypothetical protein